MKILITGAAGFVASYLVEHCLKQGDTVIGTIRWNEDLSRLNKDIKIEYVELTDLSSLIRCINKHRPDVISHLAAQSWVPYSFENPIQTIQSNTIGTLNLLEAVRLIHDMDVTSFDKYVKLRVHFPDKFKDTDYLSFETKYNPLIHICSSSEFYGKVKQTPITEDFSANPGNPYGVSKLGADFLSQIYAKYYDMNILITRMFTHTGPGRSMMSAENFYAREVALREKDGGNTIDVSDKTGMESIRTWAHVKDAVINYRNLFKVNKTGIYNISGETTKSIQEVLDYLISISKLNKDNIIYKPNPKVFRKIDVNKQIVDISKFKQDIEWSNIYTFEELMSNLLDYWRKNV